MTTKAAGIAALGILALGLGATEAAQGRATKVSVRVSGTQATQAHVVDDGCSDQGPAAGDMSESYSFTTYRPLIMAVTHSRRIGFDLGLTRANRQALTKGTLTRNSTLTSLGQPLPCGGTPASCGTRAFGRLPLQVGPVLSGNTFKGISVSNAVTRPADPLTACRGPAARFPSLVDRPSNNSLRFFSAPISASFLRGCSRATQTRSGSGTARLDRPDTTGSTTVRFTVSVTRLGCL